MSIFTINNINALTHDEFLNNGIYLHIVHATTVPPHLVLSINGKIFSLSTKGPSLDGSMEQNLRFLRFKNIKTLFVEILDSYDSRISTSSFFNWRSIFDISLNFVPRTST